MHSVLDEYPRENRRFLQPCVALRWKRTGSNGRRDNRADFFRMPHSKLQRSICAHAQAYQMDAFDREMAHDRGDIVHGKLPPVRSGVLGNITGWIAASVVDDAAVSARKIADLCVPLSDVVSEFMYENYRITSTMFFKVKPRSGSVDVRHHCSFPVPNIAPTIRSGSREPSACL